MRERGIVAVLCLLAGLGWNGTAQSPPVQPQTPTQGGGMHGQGGGHGQPPHVVHPRGPSPFPDKLKVPKTGTSFDMGDIGGRPVVEVTINGSGPYRFVLDTGATISVIDPRLTQELGLPEAKGVRDTTGHARTLVRARELRIGDAELRGVTLSSDASVTALFGARGPRGVLSAYSFPDHLLSIDYPARRITIEKGKLGKADGQTIFEYRSDDMFPTVPVRVAGTETRATVDSGSGYGLMMPTKYLKELPLSSEPVAVGQARTHAATMPVTRAAVKGAVELGKYDLGIEDVLFTDIRIGKLQANVGFEVLRKFVVTLDSKNRRIRFVQ